MSDAGHARRAGHTHQTLEFAVRSEEVVAAAAEVNDCNASIGKDRNGARVAELARTVTLSTQLPDQPAVGAHHIDPLGLSVEDMEVALAIEGHFRENAELFPILARHGAQPVQLLEVGLQPAVFGGELDDLLGTPGSREQKPGRQCTASAT